MNFYMNTWFIIFISVFTSGMILMIIMRLVRRNRRAKQATVMVARQPEVQPQYVYVQQQPVVVSQPYRAQPQMQTGNINPSAPPGDPIYR
jgi:hypothetical protein